jgi:hypothetical protein
MQIHKLILAAGNKATENLPIYLADLLEACKTFSVVSIK